jgi:hypothetical protein
MVNSGEVQCLNEFDAILLDAIDEALYSLGDSIRQTIYFHLERSFHIKKEEIPERIGAFTQAIENIFGFGANPIKIMIMKKLSEKVGAVFEWSEFERFGFVEYVARARLFFGEKERIKTVEELVGWEEAEVEIRRPRVRAD